MVGALVGIFFTVGYIAFAEAAGGPRASPCNLNTYGYRFLGKFSSHVTYAFEKLKRRDQTVLLACVHSIEKKKVILLNQKEHSSLAELLAMSLSKERICIIDLIHYQEMQWGLLAYLNQEIESVPYIQEESYDKLSLGEKHVLQEILLLREDFFRLLEQLKTRYDRLIIVCHKALSHPLFVKLTAYAECALVAIEEERIEDLSLLDASKSFFFEQEKYLVPSVPVNRIRKLLDRLIEKRKFFTRSYTSSKK
jgi:hypothetical protein